MKFSYLAAAAILLLAAAFGWRNHDQLAAARARHETLAAEARALGLDPAALAQATNSLRGRTAPREDGAAREARTKAFAKELADFFAKLKEREGEPPVEDTGPQVIALLDEFLHLDAKQMKLLIRELRTAPGLDDESRRNLLTICTTLLGQSHPTVALALIAEAGNELQPQVVVGVLGSLARENPVTAAEWLKQHGGTLDEKITADAKKAIVGGAARQDPQLAFQMLAELGMEKHPGIGTVIADAATTPDERRTVLAALREHLQHAADPKAAEFFRGVTVTWLARGAIANDGYESAAALLDSAALTPSDLQTVAAGINPEKTKQDTGKWLDWLATRLPADQRDEPYAKLMDQWTRADHQAAGAWLTAAPESPAKPAAVTAYTLAVAPHAPATAAQWALTLPAGTQRDTAWQAVRQAWQKQDPAAATKFANQHHLPE